MRFLIWCLVLAECLVFFAQAERFCANVEPMQNFQMGRFLGQWYAIQETAMYTLEKIPGEYVLNITQFGSSDTNRSLEDGYFYSLTVSEPSTPARMESKYYIDVSPDGDGFIVDGSHVVFVTDYNTYAGVFAFLPISSGHRATILSRTRTLDQLYVDQIRQKLSQCGFDLSNLKIIEQSGCSHHSSTSRAGQIAYEVHLSSRTCITVRTRNSVRSRSAAAKMRFLIWCLILAKCLVFFAQAEIFCANVEPMQNFQMTRFIGQWYAIQETTMYGRCITYNYDYTPEKVPGEYVLDITQLSSSEDTNRLVEDSYSYPLTASEPSTPARMESKYYIDVSLDGDGFVVNGSHEVFMTDYDTYAGVFKYLPISSGHRATILSRTRTLDQEYVDKIRQKLSQCGFDLSNLKIIEQSDCPPLYINE